MKRITPPPAAKPLYRALGVREDATAEDIREAFRRHARQSHPDVNGGQSAAFLDALHAYETLKDPAARAHYDATGIDIAGAIQQAAMAKVVSTAFACIAEGVNGNLLHQIRESLRRDWDQAKTEARRYDIAIEKAERAAAEIEKRWKGAEPVRVAILAMIRRQSDADKAGRGTVAQTIEVMETALQLLEPATYDAPATSVNQYEHTFPAWSNLTTFTR